MAAAVDESQSTCYIGRESYRLKGSMSTRTWMPSGNYPRRNEVGHEEYSREPVDLKCFFIVETQALAI
jgi:hypothetical protein